MYVEAMSKIEIWQKMLKVSFAALRLCGKQSNIPQRRKAAK
jgi:hypothetical protein